ncbi:MAG: NAD(P)/FAD-dependent oxidoreductase, partial [Mogibacterium sp.]|nr:NAD(P)/FAD-dependent oxidoreductase [Mogibacterium sp.]
MVEVVYDQIVIGAGASGLFFAAAGPCGSGLVLEKTARPGTKLLMSGGGHCNVTHAGSIKDFLPHYHSADAAGTGKQIRTCLYKHNNQELMAFLEFAGVPTAAQDDGRVFPVSMRAADVRDALLARAAGNGYAFRYGETVTAIEEGSKAETVSDDTAEREGVGGAAETGGSVAEAGFAGRRMITVRTVRTDGTAGEYRARAVVVATGGCSYPSTGSDGGMLAVLARDLGLRV